MILNDRAKREGKNLRTSWLPPEESDARGFLNMALTIVGFLVVGLILAIAKSLGSHP